MPGRYAKDTSVSIGRSRDEIERTLERYGADGFGYATDQTANMTALQFRLDGKYVRLRLRMPTLSDDQIRLTPSGEYERSERQAEVALEKEIRRRWRALALVIKAKLEAVAAGISTIEEEFLAALLLPDGSNVAEFILPQLAEAYEKGDMPTAIPGIGPALLTDGKEQIE